jgi:hypothetical protein
VAKSKSTKSTDVVGEIKGLNQLLRVLNKLPKDLQANVRDASGEIATGLKDAATNAAHTPLETLAAQGMTVKRDRVPILKVGRTVLRPGTRANDIFFGAEFGGQRRPTTMQFQPHRGKLGYWFYPTARANGRKNAELWIAAVDKAMKQWDYKAH